MRAIDINAYLKICGVKRATYDARQTRNEVAYAFGLARRLAGGAVLDLDCVCHFIGDALSPAFSREHAATIVRAYSDNVLTAIGLADANGADVMYLAAPEFGPGFAITPAHKMIFAPTTLAELAESAAKNPKAKDVTRITLVNVTKILSDVRTRAAKAGLDFTAPFFPPPSDPTAAKLIATAKKERELALQIYAQDQLKRAEARQ